MIHRRHARLTYETSQAIIYNMKKTKEKMGREILEKIHRRAERMLEDSAKRNKLLEMLKEEDKPEEDDFQQRISGVRELLAKPDFEGVNAEYLLDVDASGVLLINLKAAMIDPPLKNFQREVVAVDSAEMGMDNRAAYKRELERIITAQAEVEKAYRKGGITGLVDYLRGKKDEYDFLPFISVSKNIKRDYICIQWKLYAKTKEDGRYELRMPKETLDLIKQGVKDLVEDELLKRNDLKPIIIKATTGVLDVMKRYQVRLGAVTMAAEFELSRMRDGRHYFNQTEVNRLIDIDDKDERREVYDRMLIAKDRADAKLRDLLFKRLN